MQRILEQDSQRLIMSVLQDAGFSDNEARNIVEQRVKSAIHNVVAERLEHICGLFKRKEYSKIVEFIKFSESGGGPGVENFYVSFKDITGLEDIGEVLERLDEKINLSKLRGY